MKFYSKWPTFPQIYLNGKFVGGVDIVTELIESGEFDDMVDHSCKKKSDIEEFEQLLKENRVLVLIHGSIDAPSDQESTEIIKILR
jgi:glutaredoxin-related protein